MRRTHALLALCAVLLASPGRGTAGAAELTVFAAASLQDAFRELGRAFDERGGHRTTFQFAGSQTLRVQLEQGARADLFASANEAQFAPLVRAGLLRDTGVLARNRLVVIAPRGNQRVRTLADLAKPGVKLVLGAPAVPAGQYARELLRALGERPDYPRDFAARAQANLVSEESNVRQVALKVQLGEADAGVVYASDVTPALRGAVRVIPVPEALNPPVDYPVGVLADSRQPEVAREFIAFARSAEGQRILRRWGFERPGGRR